MMTVELRHIHTGMMAVAESFAFDLGADAMAGEGSGVSSLMDDWRSVTSNSVGFSL